MDSSTIIYNLSDHKDDIRKMQIGYLERKKMQDIYLVKVKESSEVADKLLGTSMMKIKNERRVTEKVILLQQIALLL